MSAAILLTGSTLYGQGHSTSSSVAELYSIPSTFPVATAPASTIPATIGLASPTSIKRRAALKAWLPAYESLSPVVNASVEPVAPSDDQAVKMAPLIVTESGRNRTLKQLAIKIQQDKDTIAAEAFNWKEGGTLFRRGSATLKFKYNPEHKGFDILNIKG